MISEEKLDRLQERLATIEKEMAENPDRERYIQLSRDHAELAPIAERVGTLKAHRKELAEAQQLADDSGSDPALRDLAQSECAMLEEKIVQLNECLRIDLLPKDQADSRDVIIEIRAGTGGDEAALFAGDLFRMYQRYAETQKWLFEVVSLSEGELGGIKEVVSSIAGTGVYGKLKFESGVHRVQRVPQTESSGRIHTSAATVAVLPQAEEVDISINDQDLRIDTFRASGAGGQHVNTTDSAVRITHLPTGIVVAVQDERSQHKNKAKALKLLRAKLFDAERARSQDERDQNRRIQIGSGDRSERIRTYNFPQGRVTDHRINLTLYKIAVIIDGEGLDELIEALIIEQNTRLLTAGEAD